MKACKTCLSIIESNNPIFYINGIYTDSASSPCDTISIKDRLADCVPELRYIVNNAAICKLCVLSLTAAYNFRQQCLEVQHKVYGYLEQQPNKIEINMVEIAMYYKRQEVAAEENNPTYEGVCEEDNTTYVRATKPNINIKLEKSPLQHEIITQKQNLISEIVGQGGNTYSTPNRSIKIEEQEADPGIVAADSSGNASSMPDQLKMIDKFEISPIVQEQNAVHPENLVIATGVNDNTCLTFINESNMKISFPRADSTAPSHMYSNAIKGSKMQRPTRNKKKSKRRRKNKRKRKIVKNCTSVPKTYRKMRKEAKAQIHFADLLQRVVLFVNDSGNASSIPDQPSMQTAVHAEILGQSDNTCSTPNRTITIEKLPIPNLQEENPITMAVSSSGNAASMPDQTSMQTAVNAEIVGQSDNTCSSPNRTITIEKLPIPNQQEENPITMDVSSSGSAASMPDQTSMQTAVHAEIVGQSSNTYSTLNRNITIEKLPISNQQEAITQEENPITVAVGGSGNASSMPYQLSIIDKFKRSPMQAQKKFSCYACHFTCKDKYIFKRHNRAHSEKYNIKCPKCQFRGDSVHGLWSHLKSIHSAFRFHYEPTIAGKNSKERKKAKKGESVAQQELVSEMIWLQQQNNL